MEWVAFLAGEEHSDAPECVSPLLAHFCITLNDVMDDEERQKLRPYLARTIGTSNDGLECRRERILMEFCDKVGLDTTCGCGEVTCSSVGNMIEVSATYAARDTRTALWLLDMLLPKEIIELPKVENWEEVCANPSARAAAA